MSSLTLNRWAQKMGLRSGHLSELARGKRLYPRPATRQKLMDGLGLSFDDLFEIEVRPVKRKTAQRVASRDSRLKAASTRVEPTTRSKGAGLMDGLVRDFQSAFRQLRRHPGFATAAVLTLALAIAADIALFSLVNTLVWKPFPFTDAGRLVVLSSQFERGRIESVPVFDYWELREQSRTLEQLAAHDWSAAAVSATEQANRIGVGRVTANFFEMLGVTPLAGRTFTADEDRPGGPPVVMLGEELWRSQFGGDSGIVGRSVRVNGQPHTVVGILPGGIDYPVGARLWVPLGIDASSVSGRDGEWTQITGRLKAGVDPSAVRAELEAIGRRLQQQYPETNEGRGFAIDSFRNAAGGWLQSLLPALMAVILLVLLIACANVANLLLARGKARERELAIRAALGAGRSGVIRQLLIEASVLAGLAGFLGLLASGIVIGGFLRLLPVDVPAWVSFGVDLRVVFFAVVVSGLAVLFFAALPALQTTRGRLSALNQGGRVSSQAGRRRFRGVLVVTEVAVSAALLLGASLLVRSVMELSRVEAGFESDRRLTVGMDLLDNPGESSEERLARFERYEQALAGLPGVAAVGAIDRMPLKGRDWPTIVTAEGQTEADFEANPGVLRNAVNADYFRAMGIPRLAGETFSPRAQEVRDSVIVSERLAAALWPDREPVGRRLKIGSPRDPDNWLVVRGVVGDVKHQGLEQRERPTLYLPHQAAPLGRMFWVIETASQDPGALAEPIRRAVQAIDPNQPLHDVLPLREVLQLSYGESIAIGQLFGIFALMALLLTSIGVYGVMSYSVTERTRELGIRFALGADGARVLREVVVRGAVLAGIGLVIGLATGLGLGRALSSMLFRVGTFDWPALAATALILLAVALLALALPAYRASRVDPLEVLRWD